MLALPLPLPLFTYGTLLDATFTSHLLEHPVRGEPARLTDYEVRELHGLNYPIVCPAPGKDVEGRIYRRLSAGDYLRLDAYEGVGEGLYQRIEVEVVADGAPERAFVYVPTDRTLRRYR